jgi:MFS family permease
VTQVVSATFETSARICAPELPPPTRNEVIDYLSWGFIVTGICSPKVGRFIEQFGGRKALSISSIFFAIGLLCLGLSSHLLVYYFAWTMLGIGMAFGLYDAAFSTLGRLLGQDAKTAIVGITLLGGLASTAGR